MARFNHGIFTKTKGKLGGVVFQQYEGLQIGKEYQPNVKNPSTAPQVASRACFALASKVTAALFPWMSAVMKANGIAYERFQRGEVLNKLRKITTYDAEEEHAVLGRLPEFRQNGQTRINLTGATMAVNNGSARITVNVLNEGEDAGVECFILFVGNDGSIVKHTEWAQISSSTHAAVANAPIPTGFNGVILGFGYALEESATGNITVYGDISGAHADNIATLGTDTTDTVRYDMSNLIQGSLYVA